jgi:Zn-dependent protease
MLTYEPSRTAYDLHFQIFGIPVRVHPLFWVAMLVLGSNVWSGGGEANSNAGMMLLIWVVVMFVSILVHELGHSFVIRHFGGSPRIVLHMMGGLAITDTGPSWMPQRSNRRLPQQQILISLAGPGAGFVLAALTATVLVAMGGEFQLSTVPPFFEAIPSESISFPVYVLIHFSLYFNIFWGLVNLLPVLPLDGGNVASELLQMQDPWNGLVKSLKLSIVTGIAVALAGWLMLNSVFMALLFGSLAASNYMTLQQISGGGNGGRPW